MLRIRLFWRHCLLTEATALRFRLLQLGRAMSRAAQDIRQRNIDAVGSHRLNLPVEADQVTVDLHQSQKCRGCLGFTKSTIPLLRSHFG